MTQTPSLNLTIPQVLRICMCIQLPIRKGPVAHKNQIVPNVANAEMIAKMLRLLRVLQPCWDSLEEDSFHPGLLEYLYNRVC